MTNDTTNEPNQHTKNERITNERTTSNNHSSIDIQQVSLNAVVETALNTNSKKGHVASAHHFVANDCKLGSNNAEAANDTNDANDERLLIITGPNMGGKSTYMRQTALIVLLAHCGSFVPAASAHIGDIDRIFTRIGSADDLAGGKSTLMVEMIETANILNQATNKSLVLMDEVGRGTATTDGLAIAHACINRLLDIGCLTLFATHYFELTQLAQHADSHHASIRNVHVAASEIDGQLLLLHQIKDGAASSSFGLHVAKMAGIPASVLNDAKRYLADNLSTVNTDTPKNDNEPHLDDKNELAKSRTDKREESNHQTLEQTTAKVNNQPQEHNKISQQNHMFTIESELKSINPDNLTPKQAHDLLYHLKEIISQ